MAISLRRHCRSAAIIAPSCTRDPRCRDGATHGAEFRFWLHPRRQFRISPPPMAISLRRHCRSAAIIAPGYTRDPRYGDIATHGEEFRFWLHPRRRFRISSPPVEILLRPDGRSAAFIAPSCTQHAHYGHFSTYGDEFRLRLHPRRRFGISPPPMAKSRRRHCRSAAIIAPGYTRDPRYGNIATHGEEFRFWLHPRRRFWISSPPVEILLRPDAAAPRLSLLAVRSTRATGVSPPMEMTFDCGFTHGGGLGFRRHLWRSPADGIAEAPPRS